VVALAVPGHPASRPSLSPLPLPLPADVAALKRGKGAPGVKGAGTSEVPCAAGERRHILPAGVPAQAPAGVSAGA
jgi:hypothetical protein